MSELPQYAVLDKQILSLMSSTEYDWMCELWKWADDYMLNDTELPRDKDGLLNLKGLKLTSETGEENVTVDKIAVTADELNAAADKKAVKLTVMLLFETSKNHPDISKFISNITYLPPEIGNLCNLEELCIQWSAIRSLPAEIISLKQLKKLCLCFNPYLVLTEDQKDWVRELEANGAEVYYHDSLLQDKF